MSDRNKHNPDFGRETLAMKHRTVACWLAAVLLVTTGTGYADLTNGLVGHWSFDDPGALGHDDSDNGHDGTVIGAVSTPGIVGNAVSFDGIDDYIQVADSDELDLTSSFTISFWLNSTSTNESVLFSKHLAHTDMDGSWIILHPEYPYYYWDGCLMMWNWSSSPDYVLSETRIKQDKWVHWAITYDDTAATCIFYNDGQVDATRNYQFNISNTSLELFIGAGEHFEEPYVDYFYEGSMDDVRIYNRALSAGEIRQLASPVVPVAVDIKPGSCPNPLNVKDQGMLTVAVLGARDCDVLAIDPASIRLEGVAPARSSYEDVAAPVTNRANECDCTTDGSDGHLDLVLKFNTQDVANALGQFNDGDTLLLTLTGENLSGSPVEGTDCVVIAGKGSK